MAQFVAARKGGRVTMGEWGLGVDDCRFRDRDSAGLDAIHGAVRSASRRGHGLPMRRGSVIRDHHGIEAAAVPCDHPNPGARFGTGRA